MKLCYQLVIALLTGILSLKSVYAEEDDMAISANVNIANDYIWRGLPQHVDDNSGEAEQELSLSGGFDASFGRGFGVGVWTSNISAEDANGRSASVEVDLYASFGGEVRGLGYELGYIAYLYPNANSLDFEEAYFGLSLFGISATFFKGINEALDNVELAYSYAFAELDLSLDLVYGDYRTSNQYYSAGMSKSFAGLDYSLSFIGNDYDEDNPNADNSFVVVSVGKSF